MMQMIQNYFLIILIQFLQLTIKQLIIQLQDFFNPRNLINSMFSFQIHPKKHSNLNQILLIIMNLQQQFLSQKQFQNHLLHHLKHQIKMQEQQIHHHYLFDPHFLIQHYLKYINKDFYLLPYLFHQNNKKVFFHFIKLLSFSKVNHQQFQKKQRFLQKGTQYSYQLQKLRLRKFSSKCSISQYRNNFIRIQILIFGKEISFQGLSQQSSQRVKISFNVQKVIIYTKKYVLSHFRDLINNSFIFFRIKQIYYILIYIRQKILISKLIFYHVNIQRYFFTYFIRHKNMRTQRNWSLNFGIITNNLILSITLKLKFQPYYICIFSTQRILNNWNSILKSMNSIMYMPGNPSIDSFL
ncbi:hypothetical protein IMG5_058540 [Ichthyophthirius multifiliis]|uniref:Transmembrane protein n=1 Tax=Ichthyophthirius multifiliis TaxID=5932 RepID=G0QNH2_ICHMU|nr:hypothetical protein IMG5_058540 [Ichthyophthirius multifiliis]EGR33234.1 hypothetical protein IMG5_058540 [Ichthyophthirius multifiliis]|eukprot:XP_004037220.1 hypothetical protein IMG5_058540 [Ichthyophthirius multifiliis]